MITRGTWLMCPECRVFVDQAGGFLPDRFIIACPWCSHRSAALTFAAAASRDVCECGCPRAAHVAYATDGGGPPIRGIVRTVSSAAPCLPHNCSRVSGAAEVKV